MNKTTTALLAISLSFPCVHGAQSLMQVSGCEPGKLSAMSDGAFSKIDWFFSARPHAKGTGYLYLYSRENPGKRFKSIEFCVKRNGFGVKDGMTVDNICVMYVGAHGIGGGK